MKPPFKYYGGTNMDFVKYLCMWGCILTAISANVTANCTYDEAFQIFEMGQLYGRALEGNRTAAELYMKLYTFVSADANITLPILPAIPEPVARSKNIVHTIDGSFHSAPRPVRSELSKDYLESQAPTQAYAEELKARGELGSRPMGWV